MTHTLLGESIQEVGRAIKAGGGGNNKKNRGCFVSMVGWGGPSRTYFISSLCGVTVSYPAGQNMDIQTVIKQKYQ